MPEPARPISIAYLGDPNSVHLRRWAAYFAERGHRITFLVPDDVEIAPPLPESIQVVRFESHLRRRPRPLGLLAARQSLRRTVRSLHPDVLHAHQASFPAWHAWLSGFHPYAVTAWGSDVLVMPKRSTRSRLYTRLALAAADLVTGGSEPLVKGAIAAGARRERTVYVHFGVDLERFRPGPPSGELRERLGLAGHRVVLSSRTIAPLYHQDTMLEALARLPGDVVAVMIRERADPEDVAVVERRAADLGVADRLRIVDGFSHPEMPEAYRLADVVVSIPASDGGPNTVVESLATGRPIVATDLPAAREWLCDVDPDALVPVGDAARTAAAIERILARSPAERAQRAERSRAAVEARADYRRTMAEMERLYLDLAEGRNVRRLVAQQAARRTSR